MNRHFNIRQLDITNDVTAEQVTIDLVEEVKKSSQRIKPFTIDTSHIVQGHSLISIYHNTVCQRVGLATMPTTNNFIKIDFFMPTSGSSGIDKNGHFRIHYELHEAQVDFLLEILDHFDEMGQPSIWISFFDESPYLKDIVVLLNDLIRMYKIDSSKIFLYGHNLTGQEHINKICKETGDIPLNYIVHWDMFGHMQTTDVDMYNKPDHKNNISVRYMDLNDWDSIRPNSVTFLNRRPDPARSALAWGLYMNDYFRHNTVTSVYPPLEYFGIGKANDRHNAGRWITDSYLRGNFLQYNFPIYADQVTKDLVDDFKAVANVGKTLEDDYDAIGGMQSRHVPFVNSSYVWLTCETLAVNDDNDVNTFITEKSLKPFYMGLALINFAPCYTIKKLKLLGWHTLAEEFGIDETYDTISDPQERCAAIVKEVMKIVVTPPEELHRRWLTAKPKIIENQKRVLSTQTNIENNHAVNKDAWVTQSVTDAINGNYRQIPCDEIIDIYKNFSDMNIPDYK